jgi:hypothetical protein
MMTREFLEKMFSEGFGDGLRDGMEKTAGGLQALGRSIEALWALKKAGKLGSQASRLASLEATLEGKIGKGGMAAFRKGGSSTLRGTKAPMAKGGQKGLGTTKAARKTPSAGYKAAEAQRGVKPEAYTAQKQAKGGKRPRVSDAEMVQARQGQRAAYAEGVQAQGVQPVALPGSGPVPQGPAYVPPRAMAPAAAPVAAAGAPAPATAAGINQKVGRARVRQARMSRYGGQQAPGLWQGIQNTVQSPGFWPAAGIGAAAGAGAVGLGAALGS